MVFATVVLGFAAVSPTVRADHDTLPWRHAGTVTGADGFVRGQATVFADQKGTIFVFYTTTASATGLTNLNVSRYWTRGSVDVPTFRDDRQVNGATNTVLGVYSSVAMDASGNLYVAYTENRAGVAWEAYVSKSVDGGATWQPEVRANAAGAVGLDYLPSIAAAPNGNVYVAWFQAWGRFNVTASVSTNGGGSFLNVQNITGEPLNGGTTQVSIATDSLSRAYVVFDDRDFAQGFYDLNMTWSDDGTTWAHPVTLSGPNTNILRPAIATDAQDRVNVAWLDTLGGTAQAWYSRSGDRGATWTAPVIISQNSAVANPGYRTSLGMSGGTLMFAWTAAQGGAIGTAFAISPDGGDRWYNEEFQRVSGVNSVNAVITADENGTFYAAPTQAGVVFSAVYLEFWFGPASMPSITGIGRAPGELNVSWTPAPEPNVVGYRVWRSVDGLSYALVASTDAATTNYVDSGLANGTYWYSVQAVNDEGILSHPSTPVAGTVGRTAEEQIADLEAELAAIQASTSENLTVLQSQLIDLQAQLDALSRTTNANQADLQQRIANLQTNITKLQNQLNTEQTTSYANLGFEIVVVALLVVMLLMQMRKPKSPAMTWSPAQASPPPAPKSPEDDL